jgi:hypothetical protein
MAKAKDEDDKKHGDKLESLIDRTGGRSSPQNRPTEDDPAQLEDDDAQLEDDDEEDLESDDREDRP